MGGGWGVGEHDSLILGSRVIIRSGGGRGRRSLATSRAAAAPTPAALRCHGGLGRRCSGAGGMLHGGGRRRLGGVSRLGDGRLGGGLSWPRGLRGRGRRRRPPTSPGGGERGRAKLPRGNAAVSAIPSSHWSARGRFRVPSRGRSAGRC